MRAGIDIAMDPAPLAHDEYIVATIRLESKSFAIGNIFETAESSAQASVSPIWQINAQDSSSIGMTDRRD
jgi:hypothetical protein